MKFQVIFRVFVGLLLLVCVGMAACQQHDPDKEGAGVTITGIDHLLPEYLSVQDFTVNGVDGAQAGKGGRSVCCVTLPQKWQPGMTAKVTWNVTNWKDCKGEDHEAIVPIEKYDEPGYLYVHFLANGTVRIISSATDGPRSPTYPGPHDPIPDKHPWDVYPPHVHCKSNFEH